MKLSIIIPAHNEEGSIAETLQTLYKKLSIEAIDHEIVVVNDNSKDQTEKIVLELQQEIPTLKYEYNKNPNGFGFAVRHGLENVAGDCIAIMMADLSDDPDDLIKFYRSMQVGNWDCVFWKPVD